MKGWMVVKPELRGHHHVSPPCIGQPCLCQWPLLRGPSFWQANGTGVFAGHHRGEEGAVPQASPQLLVIFWGKMVINPFPALPGRATLPSAQIPPVTRARPSFSCQVLHCQRPAAPPAAIFPPGLCPGPRGRRQDDGATCGAPPPRLPPPAEGLASGAWGRGSGR